MMQAELRLDDSGLERSDRMLTIDKINAKHGRKSVFIASAGTLARPREWDLRGDFRTPLYTTRLEDIPVALA